MAIIKVQSEGVNLSDTFAFTGTVTGAGDVLDATTTIPSEGGAVTTNIVQGLAKVWIRVDQVGTQTTLDSFNVTSITDAGTAYTDVAISNSMNNVNYALSGAVSNYSYPSAGFASTTTTSFQIRNIVDANQTWTDGRLAMVVHGDLA